MLDDLVDINSLKALKKSMGDDFDALVVLYRKECDESILMIAEGIRKKNFDQVSEKSHSLAGCSSNLFFLNFAKLCIQLELAADRKKLESIENIFVTLECEYGRVKDFLKIFTDESDK